MFNIIWIKRHWKIYLQDFIPCVILQISMNQNQSSSVRGNKRQQIKCFLTPTKMLICHTKSVVVPCKGMVYYISKWHAVGCSILDSAISTQVTQKANAYTRIIIFISPRCYTFKSSH